jgi:hypothetical protein
MDTTVASLPPAVGDLLMKNIGIIQIVSMYSIGAYSALETGFSLSFSSKNIVACYFGVCKPLPGESLYMPFQP